MHGLPSALAAAPDFTAKLSGNRLQSFDEQADA
jgi:hypothetical protein